MASLGPLLVGCREPEPTAEPPAAAATTDSEDATILASLRAFEAEQRAAANFLEAPPSNGRFGADPYALMALDDGGVAGVLRGSSELVVLSSEFRVRERLVAPAGARDVALVGDRLTVVGERSGELWVYARRAGAWHLSAQLPVAGLHSGRALWAQADRVFVAASDPGRVVWFPAEAVRGNEPLEAAGELTPCRHPTRLRGAGTALGVDCVVDHEIVLLDTSEREPREVARIHHDGPLFGFDLLRQGTSLFVAAVGVEDHPLDRTIGSFGYIDSFLYLYRVESTGTVTRLLSENLSERSLVVPKAVLFAAAPHGSQPRLFVAAAGSANGLWFELEPGLARVASVTPVEVPPGSAAVAATNELGLVLANPLLDAWVRVTNGRSELLREAPSPVERERLGEALLFTTLMAPWNDATGPRSRFTCETCHFEGGVDGRTHHTGRGDVRATTKPLFGLFNNGPHFTRALDPDLAKVAHAEFRVAGQNSGHSPLFDVERAGFPWLDELGLTKPSYSAVEARQAVMAFLMAMTPKTNPRVLGRSRFDADERRGAELFLEHCERCHQARASTDDPSSRLPFERWEAAVMSDNGPLVWASDGYQKTSVLPYVHPSGARTTSLRRLAEKWPYFTNGAALDLPALLEQVRVGEPFSHAGGPGDPLPERERDALLRFLQLL